MSVFGNHDAAGVAEAAEKFVSKMNESDLNAALEQSEQTMSAHSRALFIEAIFDAFRGRGESSEDAAEAAGTDLASLSNGDESAVRTLIEYAKTNQGLLKEAAVVLIEEHPAIVGELAPALRDGIAAKLSAQ
ncbi:MAG TPA: hypothetical protein VFL13_10725 [Candidatus Baltobacteraceae bacterium]|nr:hypothetical protein [Candidatus Baltobacteraceae bacterium]